MKYETCIVSVLYFVVCFAKTLANYPPECEIWKVYSQPYSKNAIHEIIELYKSLPVLWNNEQTYTKTKTYLDSLHFTSTGSRYIVNMISKNYCKT